MTAVICLVLGTASGLPQQPPGLKQVFSTLSDGQQQGEVDNNEQVPYTSIQNFTEVTCKFPYHYVTEQGFLKGAKHEKFQHEFFYTIKAYIGKVS